MKKLLSFLFLSVLCLSCAATEAGLASESATARHIRSKLKSLFPNQVVEHIQESALPGFYEVRSGSNFAYASKDGHYLLVGDVLDLRGPQEERSLTEASRRVLRQKTLPLLKKQVFLKYTPKQVKAVLTVFTDPDCGYCQKFHSEVPELMALGIEIRYLAFPRQGANSPTATKFATVWCAKDPQRAMDQIMKGETIEAATCERGNHVAEQLDLGSRLGVTGTPALLFEDGRLVAGYRPAKDLAAEIFKHDKLKH